MVEALYLLTQVSSVVAFALIGIAVVICFISLSKFTGRDKFKASILFLALYLVSFLTAVGFMSLYHWLNSELMEILWYVALNVSLLFGIVSVIYSLFFWKQIKPRKKK